MSYPYPVSVIPGPNDAFSLSQGQIQTNFANLIGWSGVDHLPYGHTNAGEHPQVSLPSNNVPGGPSTGLAAVVYTSPGLANNTASQLSYQNSAGNFLLSGVKAYALCTSSGVVATQSVNVASVTRLSAGHYDVALVANAVSSNFGIMVTSSLNNNFTIGSIAGYAITGVGTFQLNFRSLTNPAAGVDPNSFTFIVFQI